MMSEANQYYFCFRQTHPRPAGRWVCKGPYKSYDEAIMERERSKAYDAEVGTPFLAATNADAQVRCDDWF